MSAQILSFPQRAPFAVRVQREDVAWLVICRAHAWLFGSYRQAISEAHDIAYGFGATVQVTR